MKILYYTWNEVMSKDVIDTLRQIGNEIFIFKYELKDYLNDAEFVIKMEENIENNRYDCIFTFNFIPLISKIALRKKIPYIAWISDSPCLTVYSQMIYNPYNYIFHFDNIEVMKLKNMGVKNIYHMPLAVNTSRVKSTIQKAVNIHPKDVTFLGKFYTDSATSIFKVKGLDDYLKGYIQAIIDAQLRIIGNDIIGESINDDVIKRISDITEMQIDDELMFTPKDIILNMIRKEATIVERREIIALVGKNFNLDVYTSSEIPEYCNVISHGYADYYDEMPVIFNTSKINLNITLRSILSGISLRSLDVIGAGGFLISNYQTELAQYFEEGKEMVMYYDRQDLLDKIRYYLVHEDERCCIAEAGKKKVIHEFDYSIAWEKIFSEVFK